MVNIEIRKWKGERGEEERGRKLRKGSNGAREGPKLEGDGRV